MPSPPMVGAHRIAGGDGGEHDLRPAELGQFGGGIACLGVDVFPAPSLVASGALSWPRAMATVLKPMRDANCTPRCPSPPRPSTATRSPPVAPLFRSALKVVTPAHISGPASTGERSSGIERDSAGGRDHVFGVSAVEAQAGDLLRRARQQLAAAARVAVSSRYPPCQPTPTRWPTFHQSTPAPTLSITPATSWPGTRGY